MDSVMLRTKLQEMTEVQDVAQHASLLTAITRDHPNSIRILQSPHAIGRYTCFVHAFDFTEKPEYLDIASFGLGRVFAGPAFGQWLLESEALDEIPALEKSEECLVFYFSDKNLRHVGLSKADERMVSKWGIGHLYEHEIFEVPESYGSRIRIFKKPHYDDTFLHFVRFAEANGIRFEPAVKENEGTLQ